ncbi:MAG: MlaD family protein [Desulfopila sp.]|jgi:paraquat-inducible protein B|nr:MlaD family protein [Desulfopila sp.]
MAEAIVEKKKGFSPVWILPILAICLGGWLLFESIKETGIEITIRVDDSSGILANKTPVLFKGNQVGIVREIDLRDDLLGVDLIIEMNRETKPYLVEDMVFWIEKVDIRASRVSGLETLLSGNYIAVQPGVSTTPSRDFIANDRRPPIQPNAPGLHLKLRSEQFKSLDIGSGVYTQNIEIGSVQDYTLQDDQSVLVAIYIKPQYSDLVKQDSLFWNASGITISGGISDLMVNVSSLSSLLVGGINMQTPEIHQGSPQAENGQVFPLYSSLEALPVYKKPVGLHIVLETDNLASIKVGSGVYYRKVKVGEVTDVNLSSTFQQVEIGVTVYEQYTPIIRENTKFWNASGLSISGGVLSGLNISTESLESLLAGGIALATPDNSEMGGPVTDGFRFILNKEENPSWRLWSPKIDLETKSTEESEEKLP